MKIQIRSIFGSLLFEGDFSSMAEAVVKAAITARADLRYANLRYANLSGANLRYADLRSANLSNANLSNADLSGADLRSANLSNANLSNADLSGANLRDANLSGADLSGANLTPIRDDFWAVLSAAPREVAGLRAAIVEGRIDGSTYEGACACLVGTIAHLRTCGIHQLDSLKPDSGRPIERFFLLIRPGHIPENHDPSKIVLAWLDEWVATVRAAFATKI